MSWEKFLLQKLKNSSIIIDYRIKKGKKQEER